MIRIALNIYVKYVVMRDSGNHKYKACDAHVVQL